LVGLVALIFFIDFAGFLVGDFVKDLLIIEAWTVSVLRIGIQMRPAFGTDATRVDSASSWSLLAIIEAKGHEVLDRTSMRLSDQIVLILCQHHPGRVGCLVQALCSEHAPLRTCAVRPL